MRRIIEITTGEVLPNKHWKVIKEIDKKCKNRYFRCECLLCNREYDVALSSLTSKIYSFCCTSCATSKRHAIKADELVGQKFGRLTVIAKHSQNNSSDWHYLCKCTCGNEKVIVGFSLKNGDTKSCGCYNRDVTINRNKLNVGEASPKWKGDSKISPQNELDRAILKKQINPLIRERDGYTCQKCNQCSGYLEVHHIFDFATYPDLKFEPYNLLTLCKTCHEDFHKIYPKKLTNTLDDLEKFTNKEYKYRNELLGVLKSCQI
jgi:5-methylcytosine-specific restriction endonuclease McrA